jgi:hypothetical protein
MGCGLRHIDDKMSSRIPNEINNLQCGSWLCRGLARIAAKVADCGAVVASAIQNGAAD